LWRQGTEWNRSIRLMSVIRAKRPDARNADRESQ
jgi:hypothetical protein